MSEWRLKPALWILALVLLAAACERDGVILWTDLGGGAAAGGSAEGGDGGTPKVPPPHPSSGSLIGVHGNSIPLCPSPEEAPICECPPDAPCMCEPISELPCNINCAAGGCQLDCMSFLPCGFECEKDCVVTCHPQTNCTLGCAEGCSLACLDDAHCALWSWGGQSEMYCSFFANCDCDPNQGCNCVGPGCPE